MVDGQIVLTSENAPPAGGTRPTPRVALVVVHWNRPVECLRTLEAFRSQGFPLDAIIVDNGSRQQCLEILTRSMGCAHFIGLPSNVGWGPAVNAGLKHWLANHDHEWVIVAPHDALPHEGCLAKIFAELGRRARAGIACAEYGRSACPTYGWLHGAQYTACPLGQGWQAVAFPHGTLMVFRRTMLRDLGLFDECYFAYGEETEFGFRARRAGWEVGQVWGALVSNPIRQATSDLTWYLLVRNSLLNVYQISGLMPACVRTIAALLGVLRNTVVPAPSHDRCSPCVRLKAIKDFWLGNLGAPPPDLLRDPSSSPPLVSSQSESA